MIGVAPPAPLNDLGDSGAWLYDERPPNAHAQRVRVGARSSPDAPGRPPAAGERKALGSAPTMLSMPAVSPQSVRPVTPVDVERRTGGTGQTGEP